MKNLKVLNQKARVKQVFSLNGSFNSKEGKNSIKGLIVDGEWIKNWYN